MTYFDTRRLNVFILFQNMSGECTMQLTCVAVGHSWKVSVHKLEVIHSHFEIEVRPQAPPIARPGLPRGRARDLTSLSSLLRSLCRTLHTTAKIDRLTMISTGGLKLLRVGLATLKPGFCKSLGYAA